MHIKRIKKKSGVYLAQYESYRDEDGNVKTRYCGYLGKEGEEKGVPLPKKSAHVETPLYPEISKRAGDVKLMWAIAEEKLNMPRIIDEVCCGDGYIEGKTPGKILTTWAINKALNPESAANLPEWVNTTVLPDLCGLPGDYFTDSAFYSALDRVCFKDNTADGLTDFSSLISDELYRVWRENNPIPHTENETLAYDLTPVLIFGNGDEFGEKGHNSKKSRQKQINLCILVSKFDKVPVSYHILPGSFNSMSSVKDLLVQLIDNSFEPGTIIWDRGNTSEISVKDIEMLGWKLICGVPRSSDDALKILEDTNVHTTVTNRVRTTGSSALYAKRGDGLLFGKQNAGVVYVNLAKRTEFIDARNEALGEIGHDLDNLKEENVQLSESKLKSKVDEIIGNYAEFFKIDLIKTGKEHSMNWAYNDEAIEKAVSLDGKYLLYSTDTSLKASDVVNEYVGKDFVEKSFRTLKSDLKMAPVRHWKNHRIRAIFFVNILALWLRTICEFTLKQIPKNKREYDYEELLRRLKRVQYVEIECGNEEKAYWYLNKSQKLDDQLKIMGFKNLLREKRLAPE